MRARIKRGKAAVCLATALLSGWVCADVQWDPSQTPATPSGGSGTWNLSAANWSNGVIDVPWDSTNAIFGGTGGVVTLGDAISAAQVTFNSGGYTLQASNAANTLSLSSGAILAQNAAVSGINTIAGPINFNGATINVNGGTLLFTNTSSASPNSVASSTFNVAAGATLGFNAVTGSNPLGGAAINLNGGTLQIAPTSSGTAGSFNSRFGAGNIFTVIQSTDFNSTLVANSPPVMSGQTGLSPAPAAGINFNPDYPSSPPPFYVGGPSTNFSARFTGALNITTGGAYTFQLISDDASRVFIDNQQVVLDNGGHIQATVNGTPINLARGQHDFRVDYTQTGGGSRLSWNYSGPDTGNAMTLVPAAALQTVDPISMGNNVTVTSDSGLNLSGVNYSRLGMGSLTFAPTSGTASLKITGETGHTVTFSSTTLSGTDTIDTSADVYVGQIGGTSSAILVKKGSGQLIFDQIVVRNNLDIGNTIDIQQGRVLLMGGFPGAPPGQTQNSFNPEGGANLQLNGGTLTLDTRFSNYGFDNKLITTAAGGLLENATAGVPITIRNGRTNVSDFFQGDLRVSTLAVNVTPPALSGTNASGSFLNLTGPFTGPGNVVKIASPVSGVGQDPGSGTDLGTLAFAGSSPNWQGGVVGQVGSGTIQGDFINATDLPFGPNPLTLHNERLILAGQTGSTVYTAGNALNIDSDLTLDLERLNSATNMTYQMGALNLTGNRTLTQVGNFNSNVTFTGASFGGNTTLNINATSMTLGPISETTPSVLTKDGMNTLIFAGAAGYSGGTIISNGTLQMGAGTLAITPLTITGGLLDLNGTSQTSGPLSSNVDLAHGAGVVTNSAAGTATLTIIGNGHFAGNINDGAGKVALVLAPGTSQSLSSASTMSGGITIGGGATLSARQPILGSALGSGTVTLAGGTLALQGQQQILAASQQVGLAAQFYNVTPLKIAGGAPSPSFASLGALNTHLNGLTPTANVQTTAGGKDNFDFSNSNYASGTPFGQSPASSGDTTADYGFSGATNFEAKFSGYIFVPQAGTAVFQTTSDDGSALWIDDNYTAVVNNNFFQGATTRSASYTFATPGLHAITIGYFQGLAGDGVKVVWTPPGGTTHTLLNSEVATADLGLAPAQSYANPISVTANSTIDVSGSLAASLGDMSIGNRTLFITSSDSTAAPYSLTTPSLTMTGGGNTFLNVTNSAGGGAGTWNVGSLHGGLSLNSLHKTGAGTLITTGVSDYSGILFIDSGHVIVSASAILSNAVNVNAGGALGGLGTVNGALYVFARGELSPSLEGSAPIGSFHVQVAAFDSESRLSPMLVSPEGLSPLYDSVIYTTGIDGTADIHPDDLQYAGPSTGGKFWIVDGTSGSDPIGGSFALSWQGVPIPDGGTFQDANGFIYRVNYDAANDPMGSGHDVLLTALTPEPASASILVLLAGGLLIRRRQH